VMMFMKLIGRLPMEQSAYIEKAANIATASGS